MKSKGKFAYLDICDDIIIQILDIQRQNHHLRNTRRTPSDKDVSLLLGNVIASSKSSIVLDQNTTKSFPCSSFNNANDRKLDQQIPPVILEAGNPIPFHIKSEPFFEEENNSYRIDTSTASDYSGQRREQEPAAAAQEHDLEEQSEDAMRKKYLQLQIRNLQIVNYKGMLEVIKLERELGIARTEIPQSLNMNFNL